MDKIHPDNRALAERAAHLVGLDLAGIDLLIPDISVSWRESGALICEVNAQPQFGSITAGHVYREILQTQLRGEGRIPSIALLGGQAARGLADQLVQHLSDAGWQVGRADGVTAKIGASDLLCEKDAYTQGRALLLQNDTDALVLQIQDMTFLEQGLPCDRFDFVAISDDVETDLLNGVLPNLLPACSRAVVVAASFSYLKDLQVLCLEYGVRLIIEPGDRLLVACVLEYWLDARLMGRNVRNAADPAYA